jgi:hypothetical protein
VEDVCEEVHEEEFWAKREELTGRILLHNELNNL